MMGKSLEISVRHEFELNLCSGKMIYFLEELMKERGIKSAPEGFGRNFPHPSHPFDFDPDEYAKAVLGRSGGEGGKLIGYWRWSDDLGGQMNREKWRQLLADEEAGTIGVEDRDYLAYLRACAARGGRATGAEYKRLSEADTLTERERAKLERVRDARSRGGKKGRKATAAEEYKRLSEADTLTEPDRTKLERLERQRAQHVAHGKKNAEKRWGAVTTLNDELEAILTENQGGWMTIKEIYDRMKKRGFVNLPTFKNFPKSRCVKKYKEKSKSSLIWEHQTGTRDRPAVFRLSYNATTAGAG